MAHRDPQEIEIAVSAEHNAHEERRMANGCETAGRSGKGSNGKIWKNVALFLAGCVFTLTGVWATHVRGEVTREQVTDLIEARSPYSADRQMLLESNKQQDAKLEKLNEQVQLLRENMAQIMQKLNVRK